MLKRPEWLHTSRQAQFRQPPPNGQNSLPGAASRSSFYFHSSTLTASRCKNINTLPLPPTDSRFISSHTLQTLNWQLYTIKLTGIYLISTQSLFIHTRQSLTALKGLPYSTVSSSVFRTVRQYAIHVSRIPAAKLPSLPWPTSKSAASSITKVKSATIPSQLSLTCDRNGIVVYAIKPSTRCLSKSQWVHT